jgi:hypothetical protein
VSWDATLYDDRGHVEGDWNYTHNTNGMINLAAVRLSDEPTWWKQLDGMTGVQGAEYLRRIVKALEADPERFRAMNPPNGWGDYDSLLKVLREMRDTVLEWPTRWHVSG